MELSWFLLPIAWLFKAACYWTVFRLRSIRATVVSCLVIAGAPLFLWIFPIPSFLAILLAIGIAVFLTMQYTGVDFIPDGLFIPLGIETVVRIVLAVIA